MGDWNSQHNRAVWFDVSVVDLDRAAAFYEAVLGVKVHLEQFGEQRFGVLDHEGGNGGCLIPSTEPIAVGSVLLYLNVDGRIRAAVDAVSLHGGQVLQPIHGIGPHGFRALILDSEGNRLALHSNTDA